MNRTRIQQLAGILTESTLREIGKTPTQPYSWEQVIFDEDNRVYNFNTSQDPSRPELGANYEVDLQEMEPERRDIPDEENGPSLAVQFGVIDRYGYKSTKTITNRGEIYRVLSTVAEIVQHDLQKHKYIKTLEFVPAQRPDRDTYQSNARSRVYIDYIIKRLGNSIDPESAIRTDNSDTTYVELPKR